MKSKQLVTNNFKYRNETFKFLYKTFKNLVSWIRHLNFLKHYFWDFLVGLHP
jgi:hypothetical protein